MTEEKTFSKEELKEVYNYVLLYYEGSRKRLYKLILDDPESYLDARGEKLKISVVSDLVEANRLIEISELLAKKQLCPSDFTTHDQIRLGNLQRQNH